MRLAQVQTQGSIMPWLIGGGAVIAAVGGVIAILAALPSYSWDVKWVGVDGAPRELSFDEEEGARAFADQIIKEGLSESYVLLTSRKNDKTTKVEVLKKGTS